MNATHPHIRPVESDNNSPDTSREQESVNAMLRQRLRLTAATIATTCDDGKATAFRIPARSVIVVLDSLCLDPMEPNRQVRVEWEGTIVRMFATDIQKRGKRVEGNSSGNVRDLVQAVRDPAR